MLTKNLILVIIRLYKEKCLDLTYFADCISVYLGKFLWLVLSVSVDSAPFDLELCHFADICCVPEYPKL